MSLSEPFVRRPTATTLLTLGVALAGTLAGKPISRSAAAMASTASPSDAPGARLNDSVTAGNCPW